MIIIYYVNLAFIFFIFVFIIFDDNVWRTDWKKEKKEIEATTTTTTTTITTTKKNDHRNRAFWMFTSWLTLRFSFINNEKTFIIMTEIWNLIWRCMKSVKILVIALTTIIFAILKSLFTFAKRIYMMLTSSNKHLQAIKRAKKIKNYLHLIFECDREERKEIENEIYLYNY